eukprot:superscaffoldBa00001571_g11139
MYIRILSSGNSGRPKNVFIAVEELQHTTVPGHYAAINTALEKAKLSQWKEKIVGFVSDGATVIVGWFGGVTTLLRGEVPHLVNIQCLGYGLELAAMDAMKDNDRMRKATSVKRGFSAMKCIKSDWRSKLSVNTLTRQLFISLEGPDMEQFNSMSAVDRRQDDSNAAASFKASLSSQLLIISMILAQARTQ